MLTALAAVYMCVSWIAYIGLTVIIATEPSAQGAAVWIGATLHMALAGALGIWLLERYTAHG